MTSIRKSWVLALVLALLPPLAAGDDAARITGIDFHGTSDPNQLEITADHPIQVQKKENPDDKQIVLEIPGATLEKSVSRNIDTSSFPGHISLISPYQTSDAGPGVRIVVQLRDNVQTDLKLNGNTAVLSIPAGGQANAGTPQPAADGAATDVSSSAGAGTAAPANASASASGPPKDSTQNSMDEMIDATRTKKFTGKLISLQVRDVDIEDVFNLIAQASGFNIVLGEDVKGKITLSLVDVPWDQALDVVLTTMHLGADRRGNVLRIMTLDAITKQKALELEAKRLNEAVTPQITRVFPINYAKLDELKTTLLILAGVEANSAQGPTRNPFVTASPGPGLGVPMSGPVSNTPQPGPNANNGSGPPLTVVTDERTNSLIVRGIPTYVDRAAKIITILDTQTPEVVIEGKVVEASETFSRNIGGELGAAETGGGPIYGFSSNGGNPYDSLFGAGGTQSSIFNVTSTSAQAGGGTLGYTWLVGGNRLNFVLNMAETENKVKIVSSPRAVVLNKQRATILQSFPAVTEQETISNGLETITYVEIDGNLSLDVVPSVTSDGGVLMQLTLTRDIVNQQNAQIATVAKRNITTNVLVDSGNTLVMGGFYNSDRNDTDTGVPFLRQIPILGWFFDTNTHEEDRDELLFFITPHVLNAKKAGMAEASDT